MPRSKNHVDRALNPWKPRPSKAPPLQKAAPPPISKSPPPPPKAQLPLPRARPSQAAPLSGAQSPTVMPPSSTPPLSPAIAASESHDIAKRLEEAETIYKEALVRHLRSKCRQSILDLTRAATQVEHHHIITQISEMQQAGVPVTTSDMQVITLTAGARRNSMHQSVMKQYVALMSGC